MPIIAHQITQLRILRKRQSSRLVNITGVRIQEQGHIGCARL